MKKIFLLIVILLIITWPSGGGSRPDVNADDFIFEPDSLAVAALMTMVKTDETVKPDVVPEPVAKCNCKAGKVSYDGGRSLATCPCGVNGGKCGCADCPYNKSGEVAPVSEVISNELYEEYRVLKVTASWCGPCKVWNTNILPLFEAEGIEVKELDYDTNKSAVADALIPSIPYFMIQTKADKMYHHLPNDSRGQACGVYGAGGSDFSVLTAKNLINQLDKSIHPNREMGLFYRRMQKEQTKLNGNFWASKKEYIKHLKDGQEHKNDVAGWPLEKLSVYELKAIHDDDHAKQLGVLNGI